MRDLPDLLTVEEAAEHLGYSKRWVWHLLQTGALPGRQITKRGRWLIQASAIAKHYQSHAALEAEDRERIEKEPRTFATAEASQMPKALPHPVHAYNKKAPGGAEFTVYVMRSDGRYKIGRTKFLAARLASIANSNPGSVELVHIERFELQSQSSTVEYMAHVLARECRSHGEWFECDEEFAVTCVTMAANAVRTTVKMAKRFSK